MRPSTFSGQPAVSHAHIRGVIAAAERTAGVLRGHRESSHETSRCSTNHCWRCDSRALPRFCTNGSKNLSHRYAHRHDADSADSRHRKDARGRARDARFDVVITIGYPSAAAAKASGVATVIASGSGDPVVTGLVQSLAHPGGNVTGIADDAAALSTKRLGLLKAVSPQLRRVAMLWNKDDRGMTQRCDASAKAAQELGVTVQPLGVREPNDFDEAFTAMNRQMPDAILIVTDSLTLLNRKRVFDYALEHRLPAIYEQDFMAREGGLMSYGADARESFDRAAALAARIFQGAKPADLPFEIPTRYLFVINTKTAKAMNFSVPNNVLSLADEVIE